MEKKGGTVFRHLVLRHSHLLTNKRGCFRGRGSGRNEFISELVIPMECEVHVGIIKSLTLRRSQDEV